MVWYRGRTDGLVVIISNGKRAGERLSEFFVPELTTYDGLSDSICRSLGSLGIPEFLMPPGLFFSFHFLIVSFLIR